MKIHCTAHIGDDETALAFVQLVRAFDASHPGECMIQIFVDAPQSTVAEIETMLDSIDPPFAHRMTVRKQ